MKGTINTHPASQKHAIKTNTAFLDYYKLILEKVSFDHKLFHKEYRKALNTLKADEAVALNQWIRSRNLTPS